MVRQKSGEMTSPTPSIDSLNGALALCGDNSSDHGKYTNLLFTIQNITIQVFKKKSNFVPKSYYSSTCLFPSGLDTYSHGFNTIGSSSGVSSATSSASSLDRASTGSASSSSGKDHYLGTLIHKLSLPGKMLEMFTLI